MFFILVVFRVSLLLYFTTYSAIGLHFEEHQQDILTDFIFDFSKEKIKIS